DDLAFSKIFALPHDVIVSIAKGEIISTQIIYQGTVAGSIALTITDAIARQGEIGYWLGEAFVGKGIVTRAGQALVNFAFNTLGLYKLVIRAIAENTASIAVGKRLGFHYEGTQVKQRLLRGAYYDYHVQSTARPMGWYRIA
ncbi:MAG: GNAT family protein, partial [Chloroflexota bacterium]